MATKQIYEAGAKNLIEKIRSTSEPSRKMTLMSCLGNLRQAQYQTTGDLKAKRLAENCYNASTRFFYRAVTA